jgi:hypothetical protein
MNTERSEDTAKANKNARREIIRRDLADYTLDEWLTLRNTTRNAWYRMKDRPGFIRVGNSIRIPREADKEWVERQLGRASA